MSSEDPSDGELALREIRREYVDRARASSDAFDKGVATISAGALGLSITFMDRIAPKATDTLWAGIAWGSFSLALMCSLGSYLASERAHFALIKRIDEGKDYKDGGWNKLTISLNVTSLASVVAGAACLAKFAYINLGGVEVPKPTSKPSPSPKPTSTPRPEPQPSRKRGEKAAPTIPYTVPKPKQPPKGG